MLYFAFGSNLSIEQMLTRCPNSVPLTKAKLRNYELTYRANPGGKGVATIVRKKGAVVHGALYQCPEQDIKTLDRYEGVKVGVYYKATVTVETEWGKLEALTYIMCKEHDQPKNPSAEYISRIQQGYWNWKLPLKKLPIKAK